MRRGSAMRRALFLLAALGAALPSTTARAQARPEPPNGPAELRLTGERVTLAYGGRVVLEALLSSSGPRPEGRALVDTVGGAVTQVLKWTVRGGARMTLMGTVHGSAEAFACEVEPRPNAVPLVRNAVGPSVSRLNRAVYDRASDWVLSVDVPAEVSVAAEPISGDDAPFAFEARGSEITLRFRPRYYQKHRGLERFLPWTYAVWRPSVAGWTSWYAFRDDVTEADVRETADVLGEELARFGYDWLQIDDGYQRLPIGTPDRWLHPNPKFPSGLDALARYVSSRGLGPGIWTNASFADSAWAFAHPELFVRSPEGAPAYGNWIGYVMDAANPATLGRVVRPVYDSLALMGWRYFKLDALRHLRYEGYNSHASFYRERGLDREEVFRSFAQTVRDAIGPDAFLLACWGIRPELIGIADAVRVGNDGFGYGGLAQYNSFNNVVWRNDPDHIELTTPDAWRAATLASLTGSLLMLTDPPAVYRTDRAEIARRTAPVLFTLPQQTYDVDASRSPLVGRAATEVSGSGPRAFDADQSLNVSLYLLDVSRPWGRWSVLARTGGEDTDTLRFADLGLDPAEEHIVFEFWSKTTLGTFRGGFAPGPVDPRFQVQVFCIREHEDRPQVVATSRHVSCGGPDLEDVAWEGEALVGVSRLVRDDPYDLYLTEPPGFRFVGVTAPGAEVVSTAAEGAGRVVRLRAAADSAVTWTVRYVRTGGAPSSGNTASAR